jgi:hypothetical protein
MNLKKRVVGYIADRLPQDPPKNAVTHSAEFLANSLSGRRDLSKARLVCAGTTRARRTHGEWPRIVAVHFEEATDGGRTVYIIAEDDPGGAYYLDPEEMVTYIP